MPLRRRNPFQEPKFEQFPTIDWMKDGMRDSDRNEKNSWILIVLCGISVGVVTALIDIVCAWMTDLKQGFCRSQWFFEVDKGTLS
jgi:chloride channel 3/4/5